MGAKYTATSISGYNSSPPADDGSTSESNKIKWATIKTKLPDPIKTAVESIDTKLTAWAAYGPTAVSAAATLGASDNEKFSEITSACTVTLGDASTLGAGWMHYIVNASSGIATIKRTTGGDTIDGAAADITIVAGQSISLVVNASANGFRSFAASKEGKTLGTSQASTSGTAISFTGIPAGVREIKMTLSGVSTNGSSNLQIQIGDSGGIATSGYLGAADNQSLNGGQATAFTSGLGLCRTTDSGFVHHGIATFTLIDAATNTWAGTWVGSTTGTVTVSFASTSKALSGTLDRISLTTVNGTDAFDAGLVNIMYR